MLTYFARHIHACTTLVATANRWPALGFRQHRDRRRGGLALQACRRAHELVSGGGALRDDARGREAGDGFQIRTAFSALSVSPPAGNWGARVLARLLTCRNVPCDATPRRLQVGLSGSGAAAGAGRDGGARGQLQQGAGWRGRGRGRGRRRRLGRLGKGAGMRCKVGGSAGVRSGGPEAPVVGARNQTQSTNVKPRGLGPPDSARGRDGAAKRTGGGWVSRAGRRHIWRASRRIAYTVMRVYSLVLSNTHAHTLSLSHAHTHSLTHTRAPLWRCLQASGELQQLFGLSAEENLVEHFKCKLLQTYACSHNSHTPAIQVRGWGGGRVGGWGRAPPGQGGGLEVCSGTEARRA